MCELSNRKPYVRWGERTKKYSRMNPVLFFSYSIDLNLNRAFKCNRITGFGTKRSALFYEE
jgi:hypothetical protein